MQNAYLRAAYVCPLIIRLRWWWVTGGAASV